ncbi:MAG: response regulator transcription factor [Elusimicrobiales bacterium]|nr:response regulator transcription factor [Elusimicrobiales bacterium]
MSEIGNFSVVIVDDHPMMRAALSDMLKVKTGLKIVGEASSLAQARQVIKKTAPDIVVLDITMSDGNGLELISELKSRFPKMIFLVFSMHDENVYAVRALRAGASGYVMKTDPFETVLKAIEFILKGDIYVKEELKNDILLNLLDSGDASQSPERKLSDRELEIFRALGRGQTTRDIAERFSLSIKTIQAYRERIKAKLGVANANELIQRAVQWASENDNV